MPRFFAIIAFFVSACAAGESGSRAPAPDAAPDASADPSADAAGGPLVPTHVVAGGGHACALMSDTTVRCWGANDAGQRGGSSPSQSIPGLRDVVALAAGDAFTCALLRDQTVWCWGAGPIGGHPLPTPIGLEHVDQLVAGAFHVCARFTDRTARCTGDKVVLSDVEEVAAGGLHSCARFRDGTMRCWGGNPADTIGGSGPTTPVPGLHDVIQIGTGNAITCARLRDRSVRCFRQAPPSDADPIIHDVDDLVVGTSGFCTIRSGTATCDSKVLENVDSIALGGVGEYPSHDGVQTKSFGCAVLRDKTVWCWGDEAGAIVGDYAPLLPVDGLAGATHVVASKTAACALVTDGSMRCWGQFPSYPYGEGNHAQPPMMTVFGSGLDQAAYDAVEICGLYPDHSVRCWDGSFFLGFGPTTPSGTMGPPLLTNVAQLGGGLGNHTCARLLDGTVRCFGRVADDARGELAGSSPTTSIPGLDGVVEVAAGLLHSCARVADGTVRCWGSDDFGQLGGSNLTTSVPGLTSVVQIATGANHTCAVLADKTVRCWGNDYRGQRAGSDTTHSIADLHDVEQVAAGDAHTCARLSDKTVRCWGFDSFGILAGSSPSTSIPGLTEVEEISAGLDFTCARRTDGTAVCWGRDDKLQLGHDTKPLGSVRIPLP